ncbi:MULTISPECIES: hypothetical protein [Halomonadaceae]|uniref:hypothetical protein n=1 Tax=Halomonadaceae TaxID=28256 RepID=UPI001581FDFC|nr:MULTISPECIES: hypothetical protein [Halomonas]MDI4637935.1 hypothetical protein [Halomonas sp. BMC7]NUJ58938.1 hypothetical protein [Halomonas taeanensis]
MIATFSPVTAHHAARAISGHPMDTMSKSPGQMAGASLFAAGITCASQIAVIASLALLAVNPALTVFVLDHKCWRLAAINVMNTLNDGVAVMIGTAGDAVSISIIAFNPTIQPSYLTQPFT